MALKGFDVDDELTQESPALAACYEGAITQRVGLGPTKGRPVIKLGLPLAKHLASARERVERGGTLCVNVDAVLETKRLTLREEDLLRRRMGDEEGLPTRRPGRPTIRELALVDATA